MHKGWILEKTTWEDKTRAARSVYGISDAMVHFEDWIALDYPANSEVMTFVKLINAKMLDVGGLMIAPGL